MSVYLIDYENVRAAAFNGLEDLTESDRVIIFYTNNSDNLTFSLMERLIAAKAEVVYKKVNCGGKNSLDFQLCSYLGYLIGTSKDTRFFIISRDKGFLTMLSLWGEAADNGNSVACCGNICNCGKPEEEAEPVAPETEEAEQSEQPSVPEQPDAEIREEAPKPRRRRTYNRKPKTPAAEQTA